MDYRQIYAIKEANEKRILKLNPSIGGESGIYVFTRQDENGFRFAYVGQAVNLLERCASHLSGYQHIDLSIKKHGLYDAERNPYGWKLSADGAAREELDGAERREIKRFADLGYQLRNETIGGQGAGKKNISDNGRGGYLKGKRDGAINAIREIGVLIEKYTNGLTSRGGAVADRKTAELKEKLRSVRE